MQSKSPKQIQLKRILITIGTILSIGVSAFSIYSYLKPASELEDYQGSWEVTYKVKTCEKKDYIGEEYVYFINMDFVNDRLFGLGQQAKYNGGIAKKHFKYEIINSRINGDSITCSVQLHGDQLVVGKMTISRIADDNEHYYGHFYYNLSATGQRGSVVVKMEH